MKHTLLHTTAEVRNAGVALAVKVGIDSELGSTKIKQMLSSMLAGEGLKIIDIIGTKMDESKKTPRIKATSNTALNNPEEAPIPKAPPRKSLTDSPLDLRNGPATEEKAEFKKGHNRTMSKTKSAKHRVEESINERHAEAIQPPDKEISEMER